MLDVRVRFNSNKVIADHNRELDQLVRLISTDLLDTVKEKTPVKSGRAKRGWRLKKEGKLKYNVSNRVPYISRLDEGYSNQAPKGITRPATREVLNRANRRTR